MKYFDNIQRILGYVRKACEKYSMIDEGDRIGVGVSGGKDSLTLLCALSQLRSFYPKKFEIEAITVSMGFENDNFDEIKKLCKEIGCDYTIVNTDIYEIVFGIRKEKNPCSLCSKLRRGALQNICIESDCTKLALGHTLDDIGETVLMNLFYEGRYGCFSPVTKLDGINLSIIRPLIYTKEKEIISFCKKENIPVMKSNCPADKNTQRSKIKDIIDNMDKEHRGINHRILSSLEQTQTDGFKS